MKKFIAAFAIVMLISPSTVRAQVAVGIGAMTCGQLNVYLNQDNAGTKAQMRTWWLGYVSGANLTGVFEQRIQVYADTADRLVDNVIRECNGRQQEELYMVFVRTAREMYRGQ